MSQNAPISTPNPGNGASSFAASANYFWWSALRHGGCLIAPSRLEEFFPSHAEPLSAWASDRLRRAFARFDVENDKAALNQFLDVALADLLGLPPQEWTAGNQVDSAWAARALTGEIIKPRRLWQEPGGGLLPVFIAEEAAPGPGRSTPKLGLGRGRKSISRVIEWLRRKQLKVALLTNGRQWRLIHAGADYDAWCEWDTEAWFIAGEPGPQVEALRLLLSRNALAMPASGGAPPLLDAIQATRRGQAELSSALGERVRQAVEILLRESRETIDTARADQALPVSNRDVYIAAARLVMRLVVILFAESRNLLPRDNVIYWNSYCLDFLRDALPMDKNGIPFNHLFHQHSAWPRLLALCRMLYHGSAHEKLPILRYGGGLFTPGSPGAPDPVLRALAALENPGHPLSDAAVATMLDLITRAPVKVRQGRGAMTVMAPVDFSQLDTEYIGILYEGLLDYELRRVEDAIPVLFLNLGDQPALPLSRLEEMDDKALAGLVEKLKAKKVKAAAGAEDAEAGEGDEDEAEDNDEEVDDDGEAPEETEAGTAPDSLAAPIFDDNDSIRLWRDRATAWARHAVLAGKLVAKPRGRQTPEKEREHEEAVNRAAKGLVARLVLPGDYYLVRFGGTRKGSGTFYTKPALARPTVRRTLEPLAYQEVAPRPPAAILDLKVCDPACGSGSFLVGALRYLTGALYESLFAHHWLAEAPDGSIRWGEPPNPVPPWFAEALRDFSGINEPAPRAADVNGQAAEDKIKARLGRVVVERCLYGVDLDPLAVELARLALWVETMDPYLPFSFLDHKIKCGNALVGCWLDRFQDYPAMAWEREGGDKTHAMGVYFAKEAWTKAIKRRKAEVKFQLGRAYDLFIPAADAEAVFGEALRLYEAMHAAGLREQGTQEAAYRAYLEAVATLRRAFDGWCALWFWPADQLDLAPMPSNFGHPSPEAAAEIDRLASQLGFFHWELEFPDVFNTDRHGFSAVVGNPPWEIQKPNSKEWFSNIDPLYRAYGKQEALAKQKAFFAAGEATEHAWLLYNARLKGLGNWCKNAGEPYDKKQTLRRGQGFSDPEHPFIHQGSADVNTYKLFFEVGHSLLMNGGRLGLIVPSGIYTDRGSTDLRALFLDRCRWEWLFSFENRDKIFDIHRSFKFCPIIIEKGGRTASIRAAFMIRDLDAWEDAERHVLDYPAARILQFSPKSKAILEIRSPKDLAILEKMYANGVLLGDDGPNGWGIQYAREFDMTNDSKLFPPRPKWEAEGYQPDEYGHWLKGRWQANPNPVNPARPHMPEPGLILSRDGRHQIVIVDIEDVALPLIQGAMIQQFDWSQKGWISGTGLRAVWHEIDWQDKYISPQFLMKKSDFYSKGESAAKPSVRRIARNTDTRMMISGFIPPFPCGDVASVLQSKEAIYRPAEVGIFNSFACDQIVRTRCGGTHVDYHYLSEVPALHPKPSVEIGLPFLSLQLAGPHCIFSDIWISIASQTILDSKFKYPWRLFWALTPHERLRLRCILDAVVAHLYGLDEDDFRWILRDSDHPTDQVTSKAFARTLDPKGFWRVDKNQPPELRHTVLSLVAFADLQALIRNHGEEEALRRFLGSGPDDGWMLPETLHLADYGLGHDARAQSPQPVAAVLGPRFFDWQLTQSAEESWAECRRHAENIRKIREIGNCKSRSASSQKHQKVDETGNDDLFGGKAWN
jgi:hypothetical protein